MKFLIKYPHFLLIAITVATFFPTLFNGFQLKWDDTWQVLENPFIPDHSAENISYHFANFYAGQYSPVNTLMYIAVYKLFGFDPFGFHLASLLVHLTNVLLIFYIIRDIVKTVKPGFNHARIQHYAFFTALVFAIHPLQVESVAWISASKVVMFTLFLLLSCLCYIRYIHTGKGRWLVIIGFLYFLGFASKEQAIILPLNLLALDYIYGRLKGIRLSFSSFKKKVLLEKVPFFLLALSFWYFSLNYGLGRVDLGGYPVYQRAILGMHSLMEYLFRAIAPVRLYFVYFFPMQIGESLPWYYWVYPVMTLIVVAFVWHNIRRNNKLVLFGTLLFMVNMLLVLHILPMPRPTITADRYMYISIAGLALIAIWHVDYLLVKFKAYKKYFISAIATYFLFYSVHTFHRTMQWKDSETMKQNVLDIVEKRKAAGEYVEEHPLLDKYDE